MTYQEFVDELKLRVQKELADSFDSVDFYPEGYTSNDPEMLEFILLCNSQFGDRQDSPWLNTDMLVLSKGIKKSTERNTEKSIEKDTKKDAEEGTEDSTDIVQRQRIALKDLYKDVEEHGFDAVFEELRKLTESFLKINESEAINTRLTSDYDKIRDQLVIRPLNYGLHIQDLQGCVYKKIGDFVLALYQLVGDSDECLTSSKIKRDEVKNWNVDEATVIQNALENTKRLFPACVHNMKTAEPMDLFTGNFTRDDITDVMYNNKSIILSTFKFTNGAVSLFYPGVVEKMMEIMDGPFLAAFMNINDVMIFEKDSHLARKYANGAGRQGEIAEMLSGRLYLCDKNGIRPV